MRILDAVPRWIESRITHNAFYARMQGKYADLLQMARLQEDENDFTLTAQLEQIRVAEYIDTKDPALYAGLAISGVFSVEEMDVIFADALPHEVPEVFKGAQRLL